MAAAGVKQIAIAGNREVIDEFNTQVIQPLA